MNEEQPNVPDFFAGAPPLFKLGSTNPTPPNGAPPSSVDEGQIKAQMSGDTQNKRYRWKRVAESLFREIPKSQFVEKFIHKDKVATIPVHQINLFTESLELSADEGIPMNQFLSFWNLLPEDLVPAAAKVPALERSIKVAREKRKQLLTEAITSRSHAHPSAAFKALESDEFVGDPLLEKEREEAKKSHADKAEEILLAAGVKPCEYVQVVMLQGDLPNADHVKAQDHDLVGLAPEKVIEIFAKERGKNVEIQNPPTVAVPAPPKWKFTLPKI